MRTDSTLPLPQERLPRKEFWRIGIDARTIGPADCGGLVVRLLDPVVPPRLLVAARQPYDPKVDFTQQPLRHKEHPESDTPNRYYGNGPASRIDEEEFSDRLSAITGLALSDVLSASNSPEVHGSLDDQS